MQIHASPATAAKLSEQDAALPATRSTLEENVCNVCERESVVSENKNSPRKVSPKSSTKSAESKAKKKTTRSTELYHTPPPLASGGVRLERKS